MPTNPASINSLRRVFQEAFTARDISEPLVSVDSTAPVSDVKSFMDERRFKIVGIRHNGLVEGFAKRADLDAGSLADSFRPFDDFQVVADSTPLFELVLRLKERSHLFVSTLGQIGDIVSRTDLQKPPVRMWLFGLVTLIELRFTRMIEQFLPNGSWRPHLSEGRIRKAELLMAERKRHNEEVSLLDCLQISDKATIVARNEQLRTMTQFDSKRQLEEATKMLERLRNSLAHSQDILANDWDTIVLLTERLESILEGPPGLRQQHESEKSAKAVSRDETPITN